MRGDDKLTLPLDRSLSDLLVHLLLQNHMLMRIGFIEKDYGGWPRIKECQEQQDLLRTTAGARKVQGPLVTRLAILTENVGVSRGIHRTEEFDSEESTYLGDEVWPSLFRVRDLQEQVTKNLSGSSLPHQEILHPSFPAWFLSCDS